MAPTYQFARQNRMAPPVPPHQYYSLNDPQAGAQKLTYRGPKPSIPDFTCDDPREFARLRIFFWKISFHRDATEQFKYQILLDNLKFKEALLIADSYCNS